VEVVFGGTSPGTIARISLAGKMQIKANQTLAGSSKTMLTAQCYNRVYHMLGFFRS